MIALDEHQFSVGQTAVDKLGVSAFNQILRAHNNQSGSLDLGKLLRIDRGLLCHKAQVFITLHVFGTFVLSLRSFLRFFLNLCA